MDENLKKKLFSKDKKLNQEIRKTQFVQKQTERFTKINNLVKKEKVGYLEAEENEQTLAFKQDVIKDLLPIQNREKLFNVNLQWGKYYLDYSSNGNDLLLAGSKGHLAVMDWKKKQLKCEIQVKESIRDACFLHTEKMFAAAQKKHVYIYDNQGIELHKLKTHIEPAYLQFLNHHFLLVSASRMGFLKYHDVSTGQIVTEYRNKIREPCSMSQNPSNGIICLGDSKGSVSMFCPNTSEPLVKILCHQGNVSSQSIHQNGHYMATSGSDGQMKIWDLRTYKELYNYWTPQQASSVKISQRGLLAVSFGSKVQIWKDWSVEKQKNPYMKHENADYKIISDLAFAPYEDFLGIGLDGGFQSVVVPGSGEAQFDTFEANPFQTKKQQKEQLIHKLLEKVPSSTITLDQNKIGTIDTASKEVQQAEEKALREEFNPTKEKKKKRKMRGRDKAGNLERRAEIARDEQRRKKVRSMIDIKIQAKQAEKKKRKKELEILDNMGEIIDFDPVDIIRKKIRKQ